MRYLSLIVCSKANPNNTHKFILPPLGSLFCFSGSDWLGGTLTEKFIEVSSLSDGCALSDTSTVIEICVIVKPNGSKRRELPLFSNDETPKTV